MRGRPDEPTRPSTLLSVLSLLGSFVAGPIAGISLARLLAPESLLAEAIGMFVFAVAFAVGLQAWLGLAILGAVIELGRRLFSSEPRRSAKADPVVVPPGSFVFVPISTVLGFLAGVAIGIVPDTSSFLGSVASYTFAGAVYGAAVWRLARAGYLSFPESGPS